MAVFVGNTLYTHAQGGCYVCRRADQLVSTEVDIEGEGTLVFCRGCILDLAHAAQPALDLTPVEKIEALEQRATEATDALTRALVDQANLQERFDNLRREWVQAVEAYTQPADA
jgi:hypothetical protein